MRWACIFLPQLALDAVLRRVGDSAAPLALVCGPAQRRVLYAVNPAARALGLRPQQSLTAARALTRSFTTVEFDPAELAATQRLLAAWAYRFSSQVSCQYPRTLLLEVESSLGLFGPWPRFERRLRGELEELGFRHRIVAAPNPAAARVLCNAHDGIAVADGTQMRALLARLPINRIGLEKQVASAFARMGLRSLGQVLELPRDTLARRFPGTVLLHLDKLLGLRPLNLACYLPPETFDLRIELNFEVESTQALLFPLRRLTADLAAFLAGRDCGVLRFILHLEHAQGPDTQVPVGLLSAEREAAMLFELARGRLEQISVETPVRGVRLVARDLPRFVPERQDLFDERPQQSVPWEQLRERLRARLGDEAVQGLQALADHRPECSWRVSDAVPAAPPLSSAPRPGWLLREPVPLREAAPRILAGPERIESGWWDGSDVRRDYYLIETRSGQLGWAYRPLGEGGPWLLQGWFA